MSKEQGADQASFDSEETKNAVTALTDHLAAMARNNVKVGIGNGRQVMLSGKVTNVEIKPVWAYFTIGGTGYRTTTTADKEALLQGKTAVHLTKMFDPPEAREGQVKPIETKPKAVGFIPRSRRSLIGTDIPVSPRD